MVLQLSSLQLDNCKNDQKSTAEYILHIKVVDSFRILLKTVSDTFRSVLIYGKEQESRKTIFHNRAKQFIFLRGFDCRNAHGLFHSKCLDVVRKSLF